MTAIRTIVLAAFCCCSSTLVFSLDKWIEVRSPNFRVLSDGGVGNARRAAREFEQMRAVFANQFPGYRLESGAPLLVLAPRDEASLRLIAPQFWKEKGVKPAGYFHHGWEKQFAVLRLDEDKPGALQVVYHEYVHQLLHNNLRALPVWLDEGFAEFYGNTRFEQSQVYLGAPNPRMVVLQQRPPIPLEKLLAATRRSAIYRDDIQVFYAESWALVHFLTFVPGMDTGRKLNQFNRLVQQGTDPKVAFQQAIGDPKQVEKDFFQYMRQLALPAAVIKTPPQIDEKDFAVRLMGVPETKAELGGYLLWAKQLKEARPFIEEALKEDPKIAVAHENMGFLDFADGKDEDAVHEFAATLDLDPARYLSLFFKTMLSPAANSNVPADQAAFRTALMQVLLLNPQFAPAYVELAKLDVRQSQLSDALAAARHAEQLEPSRAGYHILSGRILLLMGHGAEAAESAQYVADRWYGPDRDEALDLWNAVPTSQRPAVPPAPVLFEGKDPDADLAQAAIVDGHVQSVTCGDKETKQDFTFILDQGGKPLTFHAKNGFRTGFSDTFWWGEDHYSLCHHSTGLRAVVRYKPASDGIYNGELAEVELRDDLPTPSAKFESFPAATTPPASAAAAVSNASQLHSKQ